MTGKIDPRAARTRDALIAAALELLATREVVDISITEVVQLAGVSRPSLYQHFGDVPALVSAAAVQNLQHSFSCADADLGEHSDPDFVRGIIGMLVDELFAHRTIYQRVLHGPSSYATFEAAVELVAERMRGRLVGARLDLREPEAGEDRLTALAAGATWLIVRWLGSDFTGVNTPAVMTDRLISVVFGAYPSEVTA